MAAAKNGRLDLVRLLIDAGASVFKADDAGMRPLMFAAQNGNPDIVRLLVETGASIEHAINSGGQS